MKFALILTAAYCWRVAPLADAWIEIVSGIINVFPLFRRTIRGVYGLKCAEAAVNVEVPGLHLSRVRGLKWVSRAVWGIPLFTDLGMKLGK